MWEEGEDEMVESEKKGIGKAKIGLTISVGLVVILAISNIWFYASLRNQSQNQQQQYNTLNTEFEALQQDHDTLSINYDKLQQDHNSLQNSYDALYTTHEGVVEEYDDLQERYDTLYTTHESLLNVMKEPRTTIIGGNVTWRFTTLDATLEEWYMPLETYVYYVNKPKPEEYHYLTTDGESFYVRKMELFVESEFFSEVINSLTFGNNAGEFVREVFNLRVQLTLYSEDLTDTPQWSGETMTTGTGDCEDFAILMASLLLAGNEYAQYDMAIQMVYMDADNPINPQTVNHVLLYITYEDGTSEFVDSTTTYVLSPWSTVIGWYFDL